MPGIEWDGADAKLFSRMLAELLGQHIFVWYNMCQIVLHNVYIYIYMCAIQEL